MLNGETAWAQLKCWSWNYLKLFEIRPSRGLHPISPWVSSVLLSESWRQDFQWGLGQKASWKAMLKTWQDTWEFHSLHLYSVQSLLSFRIYVYQATIYEEPQMAFHMPQRWVFQGLRPSDMSWFMCSSVQPGCTRLISVPFPACLLACRRSLEASKCASLYWRWIRLQIFGSSPWTFVLHPGTLLEIASTNWSKM